MLVNGRPINCILFFLFLMMSPMASFRIIVHRTQLTGQRLILIRSRTVSFRPTIHRQQIGGQTFSWYRSLSAGAQSSSSSSYLPSSSSSSTSSLLSVASSSAAAASSTPSPASRRRLANANTGGLRRLPSVQPPDELIARASRIARNIPSDPNVKNVRARARKHGAETLTALTQSLCLPLRDTVKGYETEWKRLHPFERVVADLTTRSRQKQDGLTLNRVLIEIHEARKILLDAGKDWIAKVKNAPTAKEAGVARTEGMDRLVGLFQEFASRPISDIVELQRSLRYAPTVQLDTPALVLVGAPNVGKSTIVRAISSGTPEISNYPFTTRGMTLGHVDVCWSNNTTAMAAAISGPLPKEGATTDLMYAFSQKCQVMDSPGLLARPDEERNEMEALTLAAMRHLPTAVMFVMDLSGQAGDKCSSVSDQLLLRKEMRSRFPRRPWIDVITKVDLGVVDGAMHELESILNGAPYIMLSIHDGVGIDELKSEALRMLGEVRIVLDAMSNSSKEE